MRFSTVAAITAVLVAASGVAGCSGSSSSSGSGAGTKAPAPEKQGAGGGAACSVTSRGEAALAGPGATTQHTSLRSHDGLPQMPSTVIKTGRLSIRLGHDGLSKAIDRAQQVVDRYGGFISSSNISSGRHETSTIVLRVPAERFDAAMRQLRRARHRQRALGAGERRGRRPAAGRPVGTRAQPARPVTGADTAHEPGRHGQRHDQDPERAVRHPGPDRGARRAGCATCTTRRTCRPSPCSWPSRPAAHHHPDRRRRSEARFAAAGSAPPTSSPP